MSYKKQNTVKAHPTSNCLKYKCLHVFEILSNTIKKVLTWMRLLMLNNNSLETYPRFDLILYDTTSINAQYSGAATISCNIWMMPPDQHDTRTVLIRQAKSKRSLQHSKVTVHLLIFMHWCYSCCSSPFACIKHFLKSVL